MIRTRLPVIAVVGRPNVGKSTLFNRVLGQRKAIVHETPGVTRDRHFARADWAGRDFFLVDTGGVVEGSDRPIDRAVRAQALTAVNEADLILFVVDAREGIHPLDEKLTAVLRRTERPVLLVANKVDNLPRETSHHEFWALGVGEPVPLSAISGKGSGDLLDLVMEALPDPEPVSPHPDTVRVAVIGKPNVGKSSFVNRLFGEERMVVSEVAGTTRDPVDSTMRYHGRDLVFVDTAGLRRQARIHDSIEYYAWLRAARVIREADVCLVLTDASSGVHMQDVKVAEAAWNAGCGVILVVNKWDLVDKNGYTAPGIARDVHGANPLPALGAHRLRLGPHRPARSQDSGPRAAGPGRAGAPHPHPRVQPGAGTAGGAPPAGAFARPCGQGALRDPGRSRPAGIRPLQQPAPRDSAGLRSLS